METTARIHSLNGQMDTVTIISHTDNNHVIAEYKGNKYTAVYNPFACAYYVDDIYGLIREDDHHVHQRDYIRQNDEPVPVEFVEDEHEASRDFQPSFWWNNRRYYLDNFIRCHNNPWIGTASEFPEHIHAFESDNYHDPLFLELIGDESVNIYLERETASV